MYIDKEQVHVYIDLHAQIYTSFFGRWLGVGHYFEGPSSGLRGFRGLGVWAEGFQGFRGLG